MAPGKATGSIVGGLRPTDRTQSSELPSTACAEKRVHGPHGVPLGISKALRQASLVNDIPLAHQAACNLRNSSGTDGDLGCTWHGCTYCDQTQLWRICSICRSWCYVVARGPRYRHPVRRADVCASIRWSHVRCLLAAEGWEEAPQAERPQLGHMLAAFGDTGQTIRMWVVGPGSY